MKHAVFVVVLVALLVAIIVPAAFAQPELLVCKYGQTYDQKSHKWRCKAWLEYKRDQAAAAARYWADRASDAVVNETQRIQAEPGVRNLQCLMRGGTDCYE